MSLNELNIVNSPCGHKSRILILMFSRVWDVLRTESRSSKNLATVVVEKDPSVKSFFIRCKHCPLCSHTYRGNINPNLRDEQNPKCPLSKCYSSSSA